MPQAFPLIAVAIGNTVYIVSTYAILQAAVVSYGVYSSVSASRKARKAADSARRDLKVVLQSGVEAHRTVYGRAKLSGPLIYAMSFGPDHAAMTRLIALTGHEIDAYEAIYFNDESVSVSTVADGSGPGFPILANTGSVVTSSKYVDSGFYAQIEFALGSPNQTAMTGLITNSGGQWTSAHRVRGRAYILVQCNFSQDVWTEGLPNVQAIIRGKKLYDPRTTGTSWSRNPALVIRDYLINVLNVDAGRVDESSFIAAANICDEYVTLNTTTQGDPSAWAAYMTAAAAAGTWELVSGTTYRQRRYTFDGVVTADSSPGDVLEQMVYACGGYLSYTGGAWRLVAGSYTAPTLTLTEADLRGSPQFQPKPPRRELTNVVKGSFVGPMNKYEATDFQQLKAASLISDDGGIEMPMDIDLPFTNDGAACQRLASIFLYRSRQGVLQFPATLTGLALRPGDTVAVTLPRFGFSGEVFRVEGWTLSDDLGIDLVLREEAASIYTWTPSTTIQDPSPQLNLPNPWIVPAITGLTATSGVAAALVQNDGTIVQRTLVSWNTTANAFAQTVDIETRLVGQTAWTPQPPAQDSAGQAYLLNLKTNSVHEIRARRVNAISARSVWTTINHTPTPANAVPNLARNSNFEEEIGYGSVWYADTRALRGWTAGGSSTAPVYVRNWENGTAYNIGVGGMVMYDSTNVIGNNGYTVWVTQDIKVAPGVEYEFSAFVYIARAYALAGIAWHNISGGVISTSPTDALDSGSGQLGDVYRPLNNPRLWVKHTAPSGASFARLYLVVQTLSTSYPFTAWSNVLFCVAPAGVTRETATPWVPSESSLRGAPVNAYGTGHGCHDVFAGPLHTFHTWGTETSVAGVVVDAGYGLNIEIEFLGTPGDGVYAGNAFYTLAGDVVVSGSGKTAWHSDATDKTGNMRRMDNSWLATLGSELLRKTFQMTYSNTSGGQQTVTIHAAGAAREGGSVGTGEVTLRFSILKA